MWCHGERENTWPTKKTPKSVYNGHHGYDGGGPLRSTLQFPNILNTRKLESSQPGLHLYRPSSLKATNLSHICIGDLPNGSGEKRRNRGVPSIEFHHTFFIHNSYFINMGAMAWTAKVNYLIYSGEGVTTPFCKRWGTTCEMGWGRHDSQPFHHCSWQPILTNKPCVAPHLLVWAKAWTMVEGVGPPVCHRE